MSPAAVLRSGAAVLVAPLRSALARGVLDSDARVGMVDHLDELRRRLIWALATLTVGFIAAFTVHGRIIEALNKPLNGAQPVTLGIAEPFMTAIKVSVFAALLLAFPVLMWHIWRYVAPTFEQHVRRTVAVYVGCGTLLMASGVAFAYFIALPSAVSFLTGFDAELYNVQVRAQEYYIFASAVLLSVGAVFQLPVVLLALVRFRILSHSLLAGNRKIAYVSLMALAVLMPGVDPVTTTMWVLPLGAMFEVSVLLAKRVERRATKAAAEADAAEAESVLSA